VIGPVHGTELDGVRARGRDPEQGKVEVRAKIPGSYEKMDEIVECTPLEYAERFPGDEFPGSNSGTLELLRSRAKP